MPEGPRRRVILATNIAETSLTVPGVTAVVDAGLQKVARFDPGPGNRFTRDSSGSRRTPRSSAPAARGGSVRAARAGSGTAPIACGRTASPRSIASICRTPCSTCWRGAAIRDVRVVRSAGARSDRGGAGAPRAARRRARRPRHADRPPHAADPAPSAARAHAARVARAAARSRLHAPCYPSATHRRAIPRTPSAICCRRWTILPACRRTSATSRHGSHECAEEISGAQGERSRAALDEARSFLRAIFAGYPDRVARRRERGSPRFLLASGHGAVLGRESGVRDAEFIVAIDVQRRQARRRRPEATIRIASAIEPDWLRRGSRDSLSHGSHGLHGSKTEHVFDAASGRVRAVEREYYGEIPIAERPAPRRSGDRRAPARGRVSRARLVRRRHAAAAASAVRGTVRGSRARSSPPPRFGRRSIDEIDLRSALPGLGVPGYRSARAGNDCRPQRAHGAPDLPGRRHRRRRRQTAGVVRTRRVPSPRSAPVAGRLRAARAQRPSRADDARFAQLLGHDVSGGAQGTARPLPAPPLARRSLDRAPDGARQAPGQV